MKSQCSGMAAGADAVSRSHIGLVLRTLAFRQIVPLLLGTLVASFTAAQQVPGSTTDSQRTRSGVDCTDPYQAASSPECSSQSQGPLLPSGQQQRTPTPGPGSIDQT